MAEKSKKTKQLIYSVAMQKFQNQGFHQTSMREIAKDCNVASGLAYRYFRTKEDILGVFFEKFCEEIAEEQAQIKSGPIEEMFTQALKVKIFQLGKNRDLLLSVYPLMFDQKSRLSVMGEGTSRARQTLLDAIQSLIRRSNYRGSEKSSLDLTVFLYGIEQLITLYWFNDASPDFTNTHKLMDYNRKFVRFLRSMLFVPGTGKVLSNFSGLLLPLFVPPKPS